MSRSLTIGRRSVELTHPERSYDPDGGSTKADVVDYYRRIASTMLPYLKDRALTMHRFPEGIHNEGFYQQKRPQHLPRWVGAATLPKRSGGELTHTVVESTAALAELANLGCLTPHLWLSRTDRPEQPDQLVFDLDPPDDTAELPLAELRRAALELRDLLAEGGLYPLLKSSGSRGFHVVVPLRRGPSFERVRRLAQKLAEILSSRHPEHFTVAQRKAERGRRIFIDTLRNAYGQHVVAPYALRARPNLPVAAPLAWHELEQGTIEPRRYDISNLFRRLGQRDDPWHGAWRHARSLRQAEEVFGV